MTLTTKSEYTVLFEINLIRRPKMIRNFRIVHIGNLKIFNIYSVINENREIQLNFVVEDYVFCQT